MLKAKTPKNTDATINISRESFRRLVRIRDARNLGTIKNAAHTIIAEAAAK